MEDSLIMKELIKGEPQSFEYLVTLYEKSVYRFIYHMVHNIHTAEDLTQEVFIKVFESLHKINDKFLIRPWLFKVAYNTTLNYLKKNKNRDTYLMDENALDRDYIDDCETRYVVLKEIQSFKPDCRAIFILKLIEDLSFEQIALILGISLGAVKMKYYRNKKILVDRLISSFKEV